MELSEAILTRRSIRGFLDQPVPREILEQVLSLAGRAVSAVNSQPWEFLVVTGDHLNRLRESNAANFRSGKEKDFNSFIPKESVYKERARKVGKDIFALMGITREDAQRRKEWYEYGYRFFNAPAVILVALDQTLDAASFRLDVGCAVQTLCFAALEFGLGTCVQEQAVAYQQDTRKILQLPETKQLITGIAIGYPDMEFPANQLVTEREPVDVLTKWFL